MSAFSTDETTYKLLRDKIKSKIDAAKFFAGFVSIVFGILLKEVISNNTSLLPVVAVGLLIFSISASMSAIFAYDGLLLPPRFVDEKASLESLNKKLLDSMGRAWTFLFLPSVVTFVLALIIFVAYQIESVVAWTILVVAPLAALIIKKLCIKKLCTD